MNYKDQVKELLHFLPDGMPMMLLFASDKCASFAGLKYLEKRSKEDGHYTSNFMQLYNADVRKYAMNKECMTSEMRAQADEMQDLASVIEVKFQAFISKSPRTQKMSSIAIATELLESFSELGQYLFSGDNTKHYETKELLKRIFDHTHPFVDEMTEVTKEQWDYLLKRKPLSNSGKCPECKRHMNNHDAFCVHADSGLIDEHQEQALGMAINQVATGDVTLSDEDLMKLFPPSPIHSGVPQGIRDPEGDASDPYQHYADSEGNSFSKDVKRIRIVQCDKASLWYGRTDEYIGKEYDVDHSFEIPNRIMKGLIPVIFAHKDMGTWWVRPIDCLFLKEPVAKTITNAGPMWECPECGKVMHMDAADRHIDGHLETLLKK